MLPHYWYIFAPQVPMSICGLITKDTWVVLMIRLQTSFWCRGGYQSWWCTRKAASPVECSYYATLLLHFSHLSLYQFAGWSVRTREYYWRSGFLISLWFRDEYQLWWCTRKPPVRLNVQTMPFVKTIGNFHTLALYQFVGWLLRTREWKWIPELIQISLWLYFYH